MGINIKAEPFTVKVTGEMTGEEFFGNFKARPILPHALQMEKDRLRRELLGTISPESATPRARNQAEVFSDLIISIVDAPPWWTNSNNGMGLYDDNVVAAVSEGLNKIQNDFVAGLKLKQDQAKKDLAAMEAPEPTPG